jgi:hypothetical protein
MVADGVRAYDAATIVKPSTTAIDATPRNPSVTGVLARGHRHAHEARRIRARQGMKTQGEQQ